MNGCCALRILLVCIVCMAPSALCRVCARKVVDWDWCPPPRGEGEPSFGDGSPRGGGEPCTLGGGSGHGGVGVLSTLLQGQKVFMKNPHNGGGGGFIHKGIRGQAP